MTVPRAKRTRANGRASRRAILATALDVFASRGYHGTSMREIARTAGMTQPGLLHHFASKDALLLAVVEDRDAVTTDGMREVAAGDGLHLREGLVRLAQINKTDPVEQQLLTILSAEAVPSDHPLHEYFVNRYSDYREDMAATLRLAQEERSIRDDVDVEATAREIIAMCDGLRLQWLLDPERVDLEAALRAYGDRLERELKPRRRRRSL